MDLLKIREELNDIGFIVIPFPKPIKESMINHIKKYLYEVTEKPSNFNKMKNLDSYETSSADILTMSDNDYIKNFSKPFRMYPDNVSQLILDWIKVEIRKILGVTKVDSNYVSPAERKINKKLNATTYDIFWRSVRRNKNDVGPAHCDYQFWDIAKDTDDEVPVPFSYRERWKLWVPLLGCVKENILQVIPYSHKEDIPMQVIETAFGKRPLLEPKWYEKNKDRLIVPIRNVDEDCIIFHDRLVHSAPKNQTSNLRISSEFTMLTS